MASFLTRTLSIDVSGDDDAAIVVRALQELPPTPEPTPVTGSLTLFGDSTGAAILSVVSSARGVASENHAVSGAQAIDLAGSVYGQAPTGPSVFLYGTGINDERVYGTEPGLLRMMADSQLAQLAWLALSESQKVRGVSAAPVYTGDGWAPTPVYGLGKRASSPGDTVSCLVSGIHVYAAFIQQRNGTGEADLFVDGRFIQRVTTAGALGASVMSQNGASYTAKLVRVADLPSGPHTVTVVAVTASPTAPVYVDWVGATDGAVSPVRPFVLVGNSIPGTNGYPSGGSLEAVAAVNAWIAANVAQLAADGLNVRPVDVCSAITDPANDIDADGVHPTAQGYQKIGAVYLAAMADLAW